MKQISVNKSLFDNTLGLSCIENYFLYILTVLNYDFRMLYAKSYVSVFDIAKALCDDTVSYAYFNKIPRLQNVACNEGFISLSNTNDLNEAVDNHDYCCVRINPDYLKKRYGLVMWRDDHYILLCEQKNNKWICLNDNPRDIIEINSDELSNVYAGQSICFSMLTNFNDSLKVKLLTAFRDIIANQIQTYEFDVNNLETARDILGILRVTRKRLYEYCSSYIEVDFFKDYLADLDKSYTLLEYMRLRKKIDFERINQMLSQIQIHDWEIINMIKKRMELTV